MKTDVSDSTLVDSLAADTLTQKLPWPESVKVGIDIASYLGLHMLVEDVKQFTPGTPNKLGVNLKEMQLI